MSIICVMQKKDDKEFFVVDFREPNTIVWTTNRNKAIKWSSPEMAFKFCEAFKQARKGMMVVVI